MDDLKLDERGECVLRLKQPIKRGSETIESLTLKFSARALRGFKLEIKGDGGMVFDVHECAALGLRLAAQPVDVLDKLEREDFNDLARAAQLFIG